MGMGTWSTSPERNAIAILCALCGEKTYPGLARRLVVEDRLAALVPVGIRGHNT